MAAVYYKELNIDVKKEMLRPLKGLQALIIQSVKIDNRLRELKLEEKGKVNPYQYGNIKKKKIPAMVDDLIDLDEHRRGRKLKKQGFKKKD